jgi:hypothetical protein
MTGYTEYYEITIPTGSDIAPEVTQSFTELLSHLTRIAERLNNLEERIETLESA